MGTWRLGLGSQTISRLCHSINIYYIHIFALSVSKIYLVVECAHTELCFVFKSGAQKEEESGPKKGADDEREDEKEAEEAGEGSTGAYPHRGPHHSSQMLG